MHINQERKNQAKHVSSSVKEKLHCSMSQYDKQNAHRTIEVFQESGKSFEDARKIALEQMELTIQSIKDLTYKEYLYFVKQPIVCIYPDNRGGLCSWDKGNSAFKIEGYMSVNIQQPAETRFEAAKSECLHHMKNSYSRLQAV